MFARLGAKAFLLMVGVALIFFGVGLIEFGIAAALRPYLGEAWGNVVAGAIFLLPALIWAVAVLSMPPPKPSSRQVIGGLVSLLARDMPWVAVAGAVLTSATDMFLKRHKTKK